MTRRLFPFVALVVVGCGAWGGTRAPTRPTQEPDLDYPVGEFQLTDRGGKRVTDKDLRGQVWVASFVFTRCTGTCPAVTTAMQHLQRDLGGELKGGKLKLVTFTVDPTHDDRRALNEYANARGADPNHWLFLTGDEKTIHQLLQERFKQAVTRNPDPGAPAGDLFDHGSRLVVVDGAGVIRAMYEGLPNRNDPDGQSKFDAGLVRLKERVRELLK
ncbi:MAG: SCO family protein [Gemmata sp.]